MIFDSFLHLESSRDAAKTTHLKDGLFSWKITIPTLRDNSVPTNWSDNKILFYDSKSLRNWCDGL